MRASTTIVVLAICTCTLAHDLSKILSVFNIKPHSPIDNLITCGRSLGPTKCISVLSAWRAERAINHLENQEEYQYNITADVKEFPWKKYSNSSDEEVYSELCQGAERLLRYRSMTFSMIPGYKFELESKGDGKLHVEVLKSEETSTGRGMMKKLQKQFYEIAPILMVPGLIMSAILPFILPALKLMTVAVGMLNNMALSGAVFTLLRNNAFNDYYEKKIIYVNEGYKNEKFAPIYYKEFDTPVEHFDFHHFSPSNIHETVVKPDGGSVPIGGGNANFGPDTQFVGNGQFADIAGLQNMGHGIQHMGDASQFDEAELSNAQWIDEYYGNEGAMNNQAALSPTASPANNRRSNQRKTLVKHKN